jgi:hypothetical protein
VYILDWFSFIIMVFFLFFTIQYDFHILSFLGLFVYVIAVPSLLNLLLVLFLIIFSFFLDSFSVLLFPFAIVLIVLILIIHAIKGSAKPQQNDGLSGLSGLEDLFK